MGLIQITNQNLSGINWLNPATCSFILDNNVHVWRISVGQNLSLLDDFQAIMTPAEIARANRFYQSKDHNRFIISRGALRNILAKYLNQKPREIEFELGENDKPCIKNNGQLNLNYNLSHSGDWILLAISSHEVGADIEFVNPNFGYDEVLNDNFSTDEVSYIKEKESRARFFNLWTRKEALTKATAQGLDGDLRLIPCLDGVHIIKADIIASEKNWLVNSFNINEQYIASITISPNISETSFFELDKITHPNIF